MKRFLRAHGRVLGQAHIDLFVPFDRLAQTAFNRVTTSRCRSHRANARNTEQAPRTKVSGQCEVLACSERTFELPQNAETGAPRPTRTTEKRADVKLPLCCTLITSPFWRSEAAEAKPTFPFNFLRLPPAPPAVFLKGKEMLVVRRARYECARGAESPRNRSVRFSSEFPRAPRVRQAFRSKNVRAKSYNSTKIKLSDFFPIDSAARCAAK